MLVESLTPKSLPLTAVFSSDTVCSWTLEMYCHVAYKSVETVEERATNVTDDERPTAKQEPRYLLTCRNKRNRRDPV